MNNLPTLIEEACVVKRQMNQHFRALYRHVENPRAVDRQRIRGVVDAYGPAIQKIVALASPDDLAYRRDKLDASLSKGWTWCSLHPENEDAEDQWLAMLTEYEVIEDAIDHLRVIENVMTRIEGIGAPVEMPLQQRSLV